MTAETLDLPRATGNICRLGSASELEVLRETAKAVLLGLTDSRGAVREQWFPKAVVFVGSDADSQEAVFGPAVYASRSFIARSALWHWVG